MAIELTREELFQKVWERPMTKVAADYAISDVALKKICTKHRIPVPGRGFWAKKAAGKAVPKAHFRAISDPALNRIVIYGNPAAELPAQVKAAQQKAQARERRPENKIDVAAPEGELHPLVEKTRKQLAKRKPRDGLVATSGAGVFDVEVAPASIERVIAILQTLATAAEARGYKITKGEKGLVLKVDDEVLPFAIAEQTTRIAHELTEAETAAIARWEKERERHSDRWGYVSWRSRPTSPEWDYIPNGRLRLSINACVYGYDGLRRSFGDGKIQRLEKLINPVLEAFAIWAAAIKAKRAEDEERKRRWAEEERRREEQQRRNNLEKKRIEALDEDLKLRGRSKEILAYVAAVEAALTNPSIENPEAVQEWVDWARRYGEKLDPLSEELPQLLQFKDFDVWQLR